jgi:dinuclear metal center YbgI/SA1388 family protein
MMITVRDIYDLIDQKAPFSTQMSFDNAGFLVGEQSQPVTRVLVSLDITEEVVAEATQLGCQLILAHHPIIFHPVKRLTTEDPTGRVLRAMVKGDISAICAHTNLDLAAGGVNDCLAQAAGLADLELLNHEGTNPDGTPLGCGRVGNRIGGPCSLAEYMAQLNLALSPHGMRYVDAGKPVCRVAVGGGACADYMDDAISKGCDTFVTSDVKYNGFLDAKDKGINLIDAGHYPTENVVCPQLIRWVKEGFPELTVFQSQRHREVFDYYAAPLVASQELE